MPINSFNSSEFSFRNVQSGIWSFAEVGLGVQSLNFNDGDLATGLISIKNLILKILNPEIPFEESIKPDFEFN